MAYFDHCNVKEFMRKHLDEMALELGYELPFDFLFKPKEKHLNLAFTIVDGKEVQLMVDYLSGNDYREAAIYLVLPDPVFVVEWRVDLDAVRHVPEQSTTKLDKLQIERLPSDIEEETDVVVNPRGRHDRDDVLFNKFVAWGDLTALFIDEEVSSRECSPQDDDKEEPSFMPEPASPEEPSFMSERGAAETEPESLEEPSFMVEEPEPESPEEPFTPAEPEPESPPVADPQVSINPLMSIFSCTKPPNEYVWCNKTPHEYVQLQKKPQ